MTGGPYISQFQPVQATVRTSLNARLGDPLHRRCQVVHGMRRALHGLARRLHQSIGFSGPVGIVPGGGGDLFQRGGSLFNAGRPLLRVAGNLHTGLSHLLGGSRRFVIGPLHAVYHAPPVRWSLAGLAGLSDRILEAFAEVPCSAPLPSVWLSLEVRHVGQLGFTAESGYALRSPTNDGATVARRLRGTMSQRAHFIRHHAEPRAGFARPRRLHRRIQSQDIRFGHDFSRRARSKKKPAFLPLGRKAGLDSIAPS